MASEIQRHSEVICVKFVAIFLDHNTGQGGWLCLSVACVSSIYTDRHTSNFLKGTVIIRPHKVQ